jgi:hypothetical protein
MLNLKPRWLVIGLAVTFFVCGSAAAAGLVAPGNDEPDVGTLITGVSDVPTTKDLPAGAAERFGVLQEPRTDEDVLPPSARATGLAGANPKLAHLATSRPTGYRSFIVPAKNALCLISNSGGDACTNLHSIELGRGGTQMSPCGVGLQRGMIRVEGFVEDGVSGLSVVHANGTKTAPSINNNVYYFEFSADGSIPERIEWEQAGERRSTSFEVPPAVLNVACPPISK